MSRLTWGSAGSRFWEAGLDRGVLYPKNGPGVPWNGLIGVTQSPTSSETFTQYQDGIAQNHSVLVGDFSASVSAMSHPKEMYPCLGVQPARNGLYVTRQPRQQFDLSYRTAIGSDTVTDAGYKIHLVYNAMSAPAQRKYGQRTPLSMSFDLTTTPVIVPNRRPTAHLVIDTRKVDAQALSILEGLLYGAALLYPRMPSQEDVSSLFGDWDHLEIDSPIQFYGVADSNRTTLRNLHTNPSFEATYGSVDVRKNLCVDPRGTNIGAGGIYGQRWSWVHSTLTGQVTPLAGLTTALRSTCSTTGIRHSAGIDIWGNMDVSPPGATALPVSAGSTYTLSFWARCSVAATSMMALMRYGTAVGGTWISGGNFGTSVTMVPGQWTRFSMTTTAPAGATVVSCALRTNSTTFVWTAGDTLDITGVLMEAVPVELPYFDGGNAPILRTNLVPNPCGVGTTAVNNWLLNRQWFGTGGSGTEALVSGVTDGPVDSPTSYLRKTWTVVGTGSLQLGYALHANGRIPVTPGETYTISAWWRHNNPATPSQVVARVYFHSVSTGGTSLSNQGQTFTAPPAGVWQRLSVTITVPSGASYMEAIPVFCSWSSPSDMFVGMTVDCTAALAERSSVLGDFFNGNTGYGYRWAGTANASPSEKYDADLTPAWAGTANASSSALRGTLVSGAGAGTGRAVIASKNWAASGQRSIRIISNANTADGGAANVYQFTADQVGKTFTVLATCRVPETQTSPGATARSIYTLDPAVTTGPQAPNIPGVYPLRWTFTPTAAGQTLRLGGNAATPGRGDTYWDNVMLVEGNYTGPYFDGTTPPFSMSGQTVTPAWDGSANASTSSLSYYSELDLAVSEGTAKVVDDELWVLVGNMWQNTGPIPGLVTIPD